MAEEYHRRIVDVHAGRSHELVTLPVVPGLSIVDRENELVASNGPTTVAGSDDGPSPT